MTALFRTRHSSLSWAKQPSYKGGLQTGTPASFEVSSDGAANGTTIKAALITSTDDRDFVGDILVCVRATDSKNLGMPTMVKAFSHSTKTFVVDKMPAQVVENDRFVHYTTPDGIIINDTADSAAAQAVYDDDRDEAGDYWNGRAEEGGYYLETVYADNAASTDHPRITDFATTDGVFSLSAALSGDPAIGDFFRPMKHPEILGAALIPVERADIPHDALVGGYGAPKAAAGNRTAAGSVDMAHRGPGRARPGDQSDAYEPLSCVFDASDVADITADTDGTTTSVPYSAGAPDVGDMFVTEEGDVFMATADSGAALTPSPPLRTAVTKATTITGGMVYTPSDLLNAALTVYAWKGNTVSETLYGVVPIPTFSAEKGAYHKISLQLTAADWYQAHYGPDAAALERGWYPKLPSVAAMKGRDGRFVLYDGTTALELPLTGYTFDPGIETTDEVNICAPNDTDGQEIVNVHGKGTVKIRLTSTTRRLCRDFIAKRGLQMLIQMGSAPGYPGMFGLWAYDVSFDSGPIADDGGRLSLDIPFTVNRNETGLNLGLPQFAIMLS